MLEQGYNGVAAVLPPHSRPAAPLRILIVEDQADTAESLAMLLRLEGHEAETAPNGAVALQRAAVGGPDVVLLDLGLPGMDGYEVARRLRAQQAGRRPLLIAMTGYGREEDRRRSAEAGIPLHWLKPVDPDLLLRLLARVKAARSGVR